MVTIDEARNYLRIDNEDDDEIINDLLNTAVQLCTNIARCIPLCFMLSVTSTNIGRKQTITNLCLLSVPFCFL